MLAQVRFDAAPGPLGGFASEEVQQLLVYEPGAHYVLASEVYTNAKFGDKFAVLTRATLAARGRERCVVHVCYAVSIMGLPRVMRGVVLAGIDCERPGTLPSAGT